MNQETSSSNLLDWLEPRARNTDKGTSHKAASSVNAKSIRQQILAVVNDSGSMGASSVDVAAWIGKPRDTISPNMKPLVTMGLLEEAPFTRKNKQTGQDLTVYITTNKYKTSDIPKTLPRNLNICPCCRRAL